MISIKYTEITEVNLSAFVYTLFLEDFFPVNGDRSHQLTRNLHEIVC